MSTQSAHHVLDSRWTTPAGDEETVLWHSEVVGLPLVVTVRGKANDGNGCREV